MPSLYSAPPPNDGQCIIDSQMISDSRLPDSVLISDRLSSQDSRLADTILIADRITNSLGTGIVTDAMLLSDEITRIEDQDEGLCLNDANTDGEISIDSDLLTLKPLRCLNNDS